MTEWQLFNILDHLREGTAHNYWYRQTCSVGCVLITSECANFHKSRGAYTHCQFLDLFVNCVFNCTTSVKASVLYQYVCPIPEVSMLPQRHCDFGAIYIEQLLNSVTAISRLLCSSLYRLSLCPTNTRFELLVQQLIHSPLFFTSSPIFLPVTPTRCLDFSKAFDTVRHSTRPDCTASTGWPKNWHHFCTP